VTAHLLLSSARRSPNHNAAHHGRSGRNRKPKPRFVHFFLEPDDDYGLLSKDKKTHLLDGITPLG
jgi:hypothetical protein